MCVVLIIKKYRFYTCFVRLAASVYDTNSITIYKNTDPLSVHSLKNKKQKELGSWTLISFEALALTHLTENSCLSVFLLKRILSSHYEFIYFSRMQRWYKMIPDYKPTQKTPNFFFLSHDMY